MPSQSESSGVSKDLASPDSPSADKPFVVRMLASADTEIAASHLAGGRASKPVADYAAKLIEQRTKDDAQLQKLADQYDMHPPQEPTLIHKSTIQKLRGLDGHEFDRAYLSALADRQLNAIALLKGQIDYGADESLKRFAQQTLPAMQKELKQTSHLLEHMAVSTTQATQPSSGEGSMMMMK